MSSGPITSGPGSDRWRLLFAALVAKTVGTVDQGPGAVVKLTMAEIEAARELTVIEWPMVDFTLDLSVAKDWSG